MLQKSLYLANKIWSRFSVKTSNGLVKHLHIKDLDKNHIDKFLDFFMEHYVSREKYHVVCGVPSNKTARDEFRDIYKNRLENYSDVYKIVVCCQENERNEDFKIIGYSGMKLMTKDCINDDIPQIKTEEVKRLVDVDNLMYILSPVPNLLKTIPRFYEDQGLAIIPEYSGLGLATELIFTRRKLARAHDVSMGGAWATTIETVRAGWKCGYKTDREVDPEEILKKSGVKVKMIPSMLAVYLTHTTLEEQYMECSAREYMAATSTNSSDKI